MSGAAGIPGLQAGEDVNRASSSSPSSTRSTPSRELPLNGWYPEPAPELAVEITPGIRVALCATGDIWLSPGIYAHGARIAVWNETSIHEGEE